MSATCLVPVYCLITNKMALKLIMILILSIRPVHQDEMLKALFTCC